MKYYTPELEEFHVGFEYEEYSENQWIQTSIEQPQHLSWFMDSVKTYLDTNRLRVKYLDEQDIKDLGWEQDENYPTQYYLRSTDFTWTLVEFDDFINIETSSGHVNFNVTIKNKSELKKLMTQLGIIK